MDGREPTRLLESLGLSEYEATTLDGLLRVGRATAPTLAEATGVPKARIYGVLDSLAEAGYVEVYPGRPKEFEPRSPERILDQAKESRRIEYESFRQRVEGLRETFLATFEPVYDRGAEEATPTEELFYVVDVGQPSERETRRLYREATDELSVVTKSFEYLSAMATELGDAVGRGVSVSVLMLHPDRLTAENREVQTDVVARLREEFPAVTLRFSEGPLPWRGTIVDPSLAYESGQAVFLVEEKELPLSMRQAAVTDNASLVAGMYRYRDLVWQYESVPPTVLNG
jgi:sugar-specific transcriptional regulator TrmB